MEEATLTVIKGKLYPIISGISTGLASLLVIIMIAISIYDRKLVDRVSLRLQTGIAIYDISLHTLPLWTRPFLDKPSVTCTFIAWLFTFAPLFYAFLNICVGINLQLVLLQGKKVTKRIEIIYWVGSIGLALLISIPPLALEKLGWSLASGCFIASEDLEFGKMFDFWINRLITLLALLYLFIVVILVLIKLYKGVTIFQNENQKLELTSPKKVISTIKLLSYRILLYPIIMMISQTGLVASQIYYDFNGVINHSIKSWSLILLGLTGTLNFMAFCLDPTTQNAFKVIYSRVTGSTKYLDDELYKGPINSIGSERDNNADIEVNFHDDKAYALLRSL